MNVWRAPFRRRLLAARQRTNDEGWMTKSFRRGRGGSCGAGGRHGSGGCVRGRGGGGGSCRRRVGRGLVAVAVPVCVGDGAQTDPGTLASQQRSAKFGLTPVLQSLRETRGGGSLPLVWSGSVIGCLHAVPATGSESTTRPSASGAMARRSVSRRRHFWCCAAW